MKVINRIHLLLTALLLSCATAHAAAPVSVKASLDSTYLIMGKQTLLKVNLVQDKGTQGYFITNNGDTLTREVEIIGLLRSDTTDIGSNREEIVREIIIQSFDSGLYTLPPFVYVADGDTFASNDLALKVLPVPVDTRTTVHDYAGTIAPHTRIWDYLPDFITDYWWIYAIVLAIGIAVAAYFLFFKKKVIAAVLPKKKPVPPYEMAMQQLNKLKEEKLCERGQEKEYYTRLTEILRVYLDKRFGINAMEMTSTQILNSLRHRDDTKPTTQLMKQILEMADFVKFAKVRPLPDDNVKTLNMAVQFVEDTKPVEPSAEESSETDDDKPTDETSQPKDKK